LGFAQFMLVTEGSSQVSPAADADAAVALTLNPGQLLWLLICQSPRIFLSYYLFGWCT
jgi:hypothetical protein